MTAPYYSDEHVTLHHGDCIEVLRTLPDSSVDAVVTDPPYGLEFMGKAWDSFGRDGAESNATAGMSSTGYTDAGNRMAQPSFLGGLNPRCTTCGKSQRGGSPCSCDTPTFTDERGPRLRAFQTWCTQWAAECLRVLKPGGHLVAFGGSRTWHQLAAGVEDAGFEIRDSIAWLYGSGFPKSLNVAKAIATGGGRPEDIRRAAMGDDYTPSGRGRVNYDHGGGSAMNGSAADVPLTPDAEAWQGWGTALKPSFEPIVVGRKPLAGTVAANVLAHGTGALNIDATRVQMSDDDRARIDNMSGFGREGWTTENGSALEGRVDGSLRSLGSKSHASGRWPTNVVLDESQAVELDAQSGVLSSGTMRAGTERQPRTGGTIDGADSRNSVPADTYGDTGGASRFFPTFRYEAKAPSSERPRVDGVAHPTVKPLDLMRWLVRLITPPGGVVLEPFAGSGTTAEACVVEGFRCIAIEREADYLPLITSRLTKPIEMVLDFGGAA